MGGTKERTCQLQVTSRPQLPKRSKGVLHSQVARSEVSGELGILVEWIKQGLWFREEPVNPPRSLGGADKWLDETAAHVGNINGTTRDSLCASLVHMQTIVRFSTFSRL